MDDKKIFELLKNHGIEIEALDTKPKTFYKFPFNNCICFATRDEDLNYVLREISRANLFSRRLNLVLMFHDGEFDASNFYNDRSGCLSFNPIKDKIKKVSLYDLFLLKKLEINNKKISNDINKFFKEYKLTKI